MEASNFFTAAAKLFSRLIPRHIDWLLVLSVIPLVAAGLLTMNSFQGEDRFYDKQVLWVVIAAVTFLFFSFVDFHFLPCGLS